MVYNRSMGQGGGRGVSLCAMGCRTEPFLLRGALGVSIARLQAVSDEWVGSLVMKPLPFACGTYEIVICVCDSIIPFYHSGRIVRAPGQNDIVFAYGS